MTELRMQSIVASLGAVVLLLTAPAVAQTQQAARVYRIGFVGAFAAGSSIEAFRQGLRHLGYVEGKNLVIEPRYADGDFKLLPQLFTDLLRLKVDVLVVGSTPGTLAAKQAVTTVPIVFGGVDDPVGSGIVASLARPGGNITGATVGVGGVGFTGKCLELLKEAVPGLSHVAVLLNPARTLSAQYAGEIQLAARTWKLKVEVLDAGNAADLERAFAAITASEAQGIFIAPDPFLTDSSARIAQFASGKRLPAFHFSRRFAEAGGLLSYGASLDDSYRRAAVHVHRILKGAKPGDIPVEQPTKFELVINLKTAKALGLKIPQPLLLRADQIIE